MSLRMKLEEVLEAYLCSQERLGVEVYKTADVTAAGTTATPERVEVSCPKSKSEFDIDASQGAGSANKRIACRILVRTPAEDELDAGNLAVATVRGRHSDLLQRITEVLEVVDLVERLNGMGVAGIAVGQVDSPEESGETAGGAYETALEFEVSAAPIAEA